jgi:chromosome segregation ATPase
MSTETKVPNTPNQGVCAPRITSETLESTVRQICIFASGSEMKIASTIIQEIKNQREQIKAKQDELSEVSKKLEEQEKNRTIAMDQWFIGIKAEKSKFKDAEAQIESLGESIAEKDKKLAESAQKIKSIEEEKQNAQSELLREKTKVIGLSEDITLVQMKLKENDAAIKNLHTARLSATNSLSSKRVENEVLEKELSSLKRIARDSQIQLQRLEGYGFRGHQMDEDSMLVNTSWLYKHMMLTNCYRVDGFSSLWDYATDQMSHIMMQNIDSAVLNVSMA